MSATQLQGAPLNESERKQIVAVKILHFRGQGVEYVHTCTAVKQHLSLGDVHGKKNPASGRPVDTDSNLYLL